MSNYNDFLINNDGVLLDYSGNDSIVTVPTNVYKIGTKAFYMNKTITEVILPNTVEEVGFRAFMNCTNLKFVSLPTFYTKIQVEAFLDCTALTDVVLTKVGNELPLVEKRTHKLFKALVKKFPNIDFATSKYKFTCAVPNSDMISQTPNDAQLTHENSSNSNNGTNNGSNNEAENYNVDLAKAFKINDKLQTILTKKDDLYKDLPKSDGLENSDEISNNGNSKDVNIETKIIDVYDIDIIRKIAKQEKIELNPKPFNTCVNEEDYYCFGKFDIDIRACAFFNCSNLVNVQLPNLVTQIGEGSFADCTNLNVIQGKSKITFISFMSFKDCSNLKVIRIDNNKPSIANNSFQGCNYLDTYGNLIKDETVFENLYLEYISVYITDLGPSTIRALKFIGQSIKPITQVIEELKAGTLKSSDVWLKDDTTLCIDDEVYKKLSSHFKYNKLEKGLFYYKDVGLNSQEKSMHAYYTFRDAYNWYKTNNIAIVPLKYINGYAVTHMDNLMSNVSGGVQINTLDITHLDTENVTSMRQMFAGLKDVKSIVFGKSFDTSKVVTMYGMFENCQKLIDLSVESFNTSNVVDMSSMFYGCSSLTRVDIQNFDTSKVSNMFNMFAGCKSIKDIPLEYLDAQNVSNIRNMLPQEPKDTKAVSAPINMTQEKQKELIQSVIDNDFNFIVTLH